MHVAGVSAVNNIVLEPATTSTCLDVIFSQGSCCYGSPLASMPATTDVCWFSRRILTTLDAYMLEMVCDCLPICHAYLCSGSGSGIPSCMWCTHLFLQNGLYVIDFGHICTRGMGTPRSPPHPTPPCPNTGQVLVLSPKVQKDGFAMFSQAPATRDTYHGTHIADISQRTLGPAP